MNKRLFDRENIDLTDHAHARVEPGSFRDPAGFVFRRSGRIGRQINAAYAEDYRALMDSGLYRRLTSAGRLIAHEESDEPPPVPETAYKVILPEPLQFVSYPYEWCFSQLKAAALLTLEIQREALAHGMTLKDAPATNVQFHAGRPVHVDTLSFVRYRQGEPWMAYRQFCEHFLAPLALRCLKDARLGGLQANFPSGIALELASRLLPAWTWLRPGLAMHIHLHARFQRRFADSGPRTEPVRLGSNGLLALVDSLQSTVHNLDWKIDRSVWTDYARPGAHDARYAADKERALRQCLERCAPRTVCDLGANTGTYSRIAGANAELVLSIDADPAVVELNFLECRHGGHASVLPLVVDMANPSPGSGWENTERESFLSRAKVDATLALALIHHLAIGNNLSLPRVAAALRDRCRDLIVEFVPESDPLARRLIAARRGATHAYSTRHFEDAFEHRFERLDAIPLAATGRVLYHYRGRPA